MQALIQSLPSAIVFVDDGVIAGWNNAASSLYGWPTHETVGSPFLDLLVDVSDHADAKDVLEHARSRGRWEGNFRVKRSDGVLLVSSFLATIVQDGSSVERIAWVATDVIDQHLAEQERDVLLSAQNAAKAELESTLGLLEALLDSAPIGIAVLDMRLYCTQANSTFSEMIGADRPPIGQYLDDLATLPAEVAADLRRVVTTGRSITDRKLILKSGHDGPQRFVNANYFPIYGGGGVPAGAGLTWTDVTEAESAEDERARLAQRADAAHHRLALLSSTSAALMGTADVDLLLDRLARVLAPAAADWCLIEIFGSGTTVNHAAVAHSDRNAARAFRTHLIGQPVASRPESAGASVRRSGQAQLLTGAALERAIDLSVRGTEYDQLLRRMRLTSCVIVPVKNRDQTIGLLILANSSGSLLNEDDLDLAVEIAYRAALAVERAITYRNEHALAEQLQQALLPGQLPRIDRCEIAVRYLAAADSATVGGDWYDVFPVSPTRFVISVGDVVGHDMAAAVGMSRLRYLIHAFAIESAGLSPDHRCDPAEILRRVDLLIRDDSSVWATCVIGVLDTEERSFEWSNAGHAPILLSRDGSVRPIEGVSGTMLGVGRDTVRTVNTTTLFAGDRLLLCTDGLFERRHESIDTGLSRLADNFRKYRNQPIEQMTTSLIEAMLTDWKQNDDIAVIAAEIG